MENTYVGPFLIVKKLGTNRRQRVYHARQTEQQRDVALKFIAIPPDVDWSSALDKIDYEVNELQKLKHPNLVKVYGAGVHEDRIFFASELVDGESLASILSRRGKLTPDLVVEYGRQIAEVLRYLHHHDLIHSKLTPEKILITNDHQVKIADLRLNRSRRRRWDSRRRRELDIAAYMAPEQFTEGSTPKSDFYALGVIMFEMLTGKLPYEPDTMGRMTKMKMSAPVPSAAEHVMNCPIYLDKLISQLLQPKPRKRPHSAKAIVMTLEEIKKIAATKQAAVDQMTGGFNPLNAGADKTEARRLLGQNTAPEPADVSFFQSVPFMICSLAAIIALVVFMAIPKSIPRQMEDARILIQSDDTNQWNEARIILKPIMESDHPLAEDAERMYYESRRKTLVRQAERGVSNRLQSENVQLIGKAIRLEQDGRDEEAMTILNQLVKTVSPTGGERHVYYEAQARLETLRKQTQIPVDIPSLAILIESTKQAETASELIKANELLSKIMLRYAGEVGYEDVVQNAKDQLPEIKRRLAEVSSEPSDSTDNSTGDSTDDPQDQP